VGFHKGTRIRVDVDIPRWDSFFEQPQETRERLLLGIRQTLRTAFERESLQVDVHVVSVEAYVPFERRDDIQVGR